MTSYGPMYVIDCRKVAAYRLDPEAAAQFIALSAQDEDLMAGSICLGKVTSTEIDGPIVRIRVETDRRIELGTHYSGG